MCVKSARFFYSVLGSLSNTKKRERNAQKKKRHKSHAKDKIKDAHFFLLHKERAIERERRKRRTNNDVFWSDDASAEEAKNRSERFVGRDCE